MALLSKRGMKAVTPRPHRRARGFTLLEIMIAVVIIGFLAAMAVPAFQRVGKNAKLARIVSDFRTYAQAFEQYAAENGEWPANAGTAVVPTGMNRAIKADAWQEAQTAIGGRWNWDALPNTFGITAGIAITGYTADDATLTVIDNRIDDGDLTTGQFRKISPTRVMLILEE
jgi:prepilin-type N-terminal cleavage/methylation domain-containing protein